MVQIRVTHPGDDAAAMAEHGDELLPHLGPGARLEQTGAAGAGPYVYVCEGGEEDALRAGWRALEATGHASEWSVTLD